MISMTADWPLLARFGFAIVVAIVAFPLASVASRAVRRWASRSVTFAHVDTTVVTFGAELARVLFLMAALVLVLTLAGVEPTSVAAVIGAATLAIGLALQGTLANVAAGVLIVLFRPYRIGESVELAGRPGTVRLISLFTTELENINGLAIIIPNALIMAQPMVNHSRNKTRRTDIDLVLEWHTDTAAACRLAQDLYADDPRLKDGDRVDAIIKAITDRGPVLSLRLWSMAHHGHGFADVFAVEAPAKLHAALRGADIVPPGVTP